MSIQVTIGAVAPNHGGVRVYVEEKRGAQWVPTSENKELPVGRVEMVLVHGTRRFIVEEVDHDA